MFLIETKLQSFKFERIRSRVGFSGCFVVNPIRRKEGLALLWKEEEIVEIQNYSQRHIHAWIKGTRHENGWEFSGFYGHLELCKRKEVGGSFSTKTYGG